MLSRVEPVWGNAGTPGCGRGGKNLEWQESYAQFYFWTFLHDKVQKLAADVGMYLVIHILLLFANSCSPFCVHMCTCLPYISISQTLSIYAILVKGQNFVPPSSPGTSRDRLFARVFVAAVSRDLGPRTRVVRLSFRLSRDGVPGA